MNKKIIHSVFQEVSRRFPSHVAIEESTRSIDYASLDQEANRIAHILRDKGLFAGASVALFLPAGIEYVIAMLGTLKAGGVFAPLHLDYPEKRLQGVLAKVRPQFAITDVSTADDFRNRIANFEIDQKPTGTLLMGNGYQWQDADDNRQSVGGSSETLTSLPDPDAGCYMITTSGSTGVPKAILGRQKSLSHFIHWEKKEFAIDETARVSWLAPPTFDVSLRDIFLPLLSGGTLCVPTDEIRTSPARLLAWMEEKELTLTHIVPSILRLLINEAEKSETTPLPALRYIMSAGEPLYGGDVARIRETLGSAVQVVNLYGPSETTLAKIFNRVDEVPATGAVVPLGKPISNTAALILKGSRLCAIGEVGEIHIKTPFLSKGYIDAPELNDAAFIQNPLTKEEDIIYKTGDMGKYLPDRTIAFAGRADRQLKVNGNRVEPAEIEQSLLRHAAVEQVVVMPHARTTGEINLVCYYRSEPQLEAAEVKTHLRQHLPEYMLPNFYVPLKEFPLNLNGKVDRAALPKPEALLYAQVAYTAPESATEKQLAEIWGEVLGLEKVGVNNPYFEMGGSSLNAMKIIARIYQVLAVEVNMRDFFANDTIARLAAHIGTLATKTYENIPVLEEAAHYEVSHAQRRLWMLDRLDEAGSTYNIPGFYWVEGPLNRHAFAKAMKILVNRHEGLRTNFITVDDGPRQVIRDATPFAVTHLDMVSVEDHEAAAREHATVEAAHAFDLEKELLIRVTLIRFSETLHFFSLNIHHIVGDAWSLGVLAREFSVIYASLTTGQEIPLQPLELHYKDYAAWQNAQLQGERADEDRAYWQEKLGGDLPVLDMPIDFQRPPVQTFNGRTDHFAFEGAGAGELADFARSQEASPFMVLIAAFKALIHRYTGNEDVIVGTTIANREHPQLHDQIGFYVNTLALRDEVRGDQSLQQLLASVKETTSDAMHHQLYPFDRLVEELNVPRDVSRSPLFTLGLILHDDNGPAQDGDIHISPYRFHGELSKFEMLLVFRFNGGKLELDFNYNTDLFAPTTIARVANHFQRILDQLVANTADTVADLELSDGAELRHLVEVRNNVHQEIDPESTIVSLFEARAEEYPGQLAVKDGKRQVTYRELNENANALAHHLLEQGLVAEQVVGVLSHRTLEAVTAALAIFKAGGVYLPLDAKLPDARIAGMLEDSGASHVLSYGELAQRAAYLAPKTTDMHTISGKQGNPNCDVLPQQQAYLLYTSGSTGKPKGVMVNHGGFVNMSTAQIAAFPVEAGDRVLQFASLGFDASLAEIFQALFAGGTLVFVDDETVSDTTRFLNFVGAEKIDVATLPPVYVAALDGAHLPFKVLVTAGEAARAHTVDRYAGEMIYVNAYGPTEFSVCATMHHVSPGAHEPIAIGDPIANGEIYLMDANLELAPLGVPGEICMAGVNLARGYHQRAGITATSFVPHPFKDGERLYRSGDLGRIDANGNLVFLGRIDHQVKVNGRRIEPGEIAHVLGKHEGVEDAHVGVIERNNGSRELTAWYTEPRNIELWPSVAEFYIYDDLLYNAMATDHERNRVYRTAFERLLPGKIVVEPGPGPQCILSRMCIDAGAEKVYAVELLEETYHKACRTVKELGLEDKIILIHGNIMDVELPELADYCISEIVGGIGGSEGAAVLLEHTRRLLKDGSHMIPSRTLTRMAACELTPEDHAGAFPTIAGHYVDQIFDQVGYAFDLRLCLKNYPVEKLLSNADVFEDLDYTQPMNFDDSHQIRLEFHKEGRFTGFLVWLVLYSDPETEFDVLYNQKSWLPLYLPVSIEGYEVAPGDVFTATVDRKLCENDLNPDFFIKGQLVRANGETIEIAHDSYHYKQIFDQSPFHSSLFDGEKPLIIPPLSEENLRDHLGQDLPEYMVPQNFVSMESFPTNASGKLDRKALPLPEQAAVETTYVAPRNPVEEVLTQVIGEVLGRRVGATDHYFHLGGDSIKAIQVSSRLRDQGYTLQVLQIFRHPVIAEMAALVEVSETAADSGPISGRHELTAIQRWFFDTYSEGRNHFNQSVLLQAHETLNADHLNSALAALWYSHDALRTRFIEENGSWVAEVAEVGTAPTVEVIDLVGKGQKIITTTAEEIQASLNLQEGPLLKAALLRTDEGDRFLLVIHHLVVDGVSWRILAQDMETAYRQASAGDEVKLPNRTTSFKAWSAQVAEYANGDALAEERSFWENLENTEVQPLPVDIQHDGVATVSDRKSVSITLPAEATEQLLTSAHEAYRTEINDLLLTGLGRALKQWTGAATAAITLEGHGRENIGGNTDISRTVGWFTAAYPTLLQLPETEDLGAWIKQTKEGQRATPAKGLGYGMLSYITSEEKKGTLDNRLQPEILFNYLGTFDGGHATGLFTGAPESAGAQHDANLALTHALDISGKVEGGVLKLSFNYDSTRYQQATLETLATNYVAALNELVQHCTTLEEGELTVSDIDFDGFDQDQLDAVFQSMAQ